MDRALRSPAVSGLSPGKVFRIGVMGPLATEDNVQFFLKEFKKALNAEGYSKS